jgi:hypothetical protein
MDIIGQWLTYEQRWAKGPIDRSSDTDSIFRYRFDLPILSDDTNGRFQVLIIVIGRLCQFVLSSNSLIVRSCFLVLSSDFCIVRLCRPVLVKNRFTDTLFVDNLISFSLQGRVNTSNIELFSLFCSANDTKKAKITMWPDFFPQRPQFFRRIGWKILSL